MFGNLRNLRPARFSDYFLIFYIYLIVNVLSLI